MDWGSGQDQGSSGTQAKTDRQDAQLLLRLLAESRFPRIWVPAPENRNLRQLIWHRHRLVQMRTRAMNQIQAAAMNEGVRRKKNTLTQPRLLEMAVKPAIRDSRTTITVFDVKLPTSRHYGQVMKSALMIPMPWGYIISGRLLSSAGLLRSEGGNSP